MSMGFTRYWYRPKELDAKRFKAFSAACKKAAKDYDGQLVGAVFSKEEVLFDAEPGCETFHVGRVSPYDEKDGTVFEFCKTRELPYDKLVETCLGLLKTYFPEVNIPEPG
jgi:hypothetical protein